MRAYYTHHACDLSATQQTTCFLISDFWATCCSCYLLPTRKVKLHMMSTIHPLLNYWRHLSSCWCSDCWHKFVPSGAAHLHCTPMQLTTLIQQCLRFKPYDRLQDYSHANLLSKCSLISPCFNSSHAYGVIHASVWVHNTKLNTMNCNPILHHTIATHT